MAMSCPILPPTTAADVPLYLDGNAGAWAGRIRLLARDYDGDALVAALRCYARGAYAQDVAPYACQRLLTLLDHRDADVRGAVAAWVQAVATPNNDEAPSAGTLGASAPNPSKEGRC